MSMASGCQAHSHLRLRDSRCRGRLRGWRGLLLPRAGFAAFVGMAALHASGAHAQTKLEANATVMADGDAAVGESEAEETDAEPAERLIDISTGFGSGVLRGGHGGLGAAQRAPFFVDVTVLTPYYEPWLLVGGSLRVELEDGRAVAGVARVALRHKLKGMELRPGAAIPFYFAPRTMLGPEANFSVRWPLGNELGFLAGAGIAAFMIGNDIPHGTTVVMFHVQLGLDLLL